MGVCSSGKSKPISLENTQKIYNSTRTIVQAQEIIQKQQNIGNWLKEIAPQFRQISTIQITRLSMLTDLRQWKGLISAKDTLSEAEFQNQIDGYRNLNLELSSHEKDINNKLALIQTEITHMEKYKDNEQFKAADIKISTREMKKHSYKLILLQLGVQLYEVQIQNLRSRRQKKQQLQNQYQDLFLSNQTEGFTPQTIIIENPELVVYKLLQKLLALLKYKEIYTFNKIELEKLQLGPEHQYETIIDQKQVKNTLIRTNKLNLQGIFGQCPQLTNIPSDNLIMQTIETTVYRITQLHHLNKLDRHITTQLLFDEIKELDKNQQNYFQQFFEIILQRMIIQNLNGLDELQRQVIRQFEEQMRHEQFYYQFKRHIDTMNIKIQYLSNKIQKTAALIDQKLNKLDSSTMKNKFLRQLLMYRTDPLFQQNDSQFTYKLKAYLDQNLKIRTIKQNIRTLFNYLNDQIQEKYQGLSFKEVFSQHRCDILTYETNLDEQTLSNNQIVKYYKPLREWKGFESDQNKLNEKDYQTIIEQTIQKDTYQDQIQPLAHLLAQESQLSKVFEHIIQNQDLIFSEQQKLQLQNLIKRRNLQKQVYYFQTQFIQTNAEIKPILEEMSQIYRFWKQRVVELSEEYLR